MIKQGDAYNLRIKINSGDGPLDMAEVETVEIVVGSLTKTWPDVVDYDAETGAFLFPLAQEESLQFRAGIAVRFDVRVKFQTGDVVGIKPQRIDVIEALSKEVL